MPARLVMLVVAGALGCGGGEAAPDTASTNRATPVAAADGCPLSVEAVGQILGKPVHVPPTPVQLMDTCTYRLDGTDVELELSIKPVALDEMFIAGLHDRARTRLGGETRAESVALGDEGWAYGAKTGSEAAARKGDRIYHASLRSGENLFEPMKDQMVRLVMAMIADKG